jgi:hypothetical protein
MTIPTLVDLIRFSTATTGTGTLTVGSAISPFMTPATYGAPFASGTATVYYSIIDPAGPGCETGIGLYTASGTTLARSTILASTNSGSAISLSGSAQVCFTAVSSALVQSPNASVTSTDVVIFSGTSGNLIADSGISAGSSAFNLPSGWAYEINGTSVLNATTLGSAVVASSLTSVGILTSLLVGTAAPSGFTGMTANITNATGNVFAFVDTHAAAGDILGFMGIGPNSSDTTSGYIEFYDRTGATQQGYIGRNGSGAVKYTTSSDIRGKPNRELLSAETARDIIDRLTIWDFDKEGNAIRGVGVIAQEAFHILPSMVGTSADPDKWWTTEKSGPVAHLVRNVQELNKTIDDLQERIADLEAFLVV